LKTKIKSELRRKNQKYGNGRDIFTKRGKKWLSGLGNPEIDSYLRIYKVLEGEIREAERKIEEVGRRYEEVRLLKGIKGIGVYSALIIYSEIGEVERFQTEAKALSYAGRVPRVHLSGNEKYYGNITREGSKYLRWILHVLLNIDYRGLKGFLRGCLESLFTI